MSPQYQQMYQERQKALQEAYAPQVQGLQQQIASLPQQFEAQKSALQQAKENAFRDITKTAARGGMFYTGFTPREEARYLGEKYLPGLQQLSAQELSTRQGLLGQIAGLQNQERLAGLSFLDKLTAMQRADEEAARNRAAAAASGYSDIDPNDLDPNKLVTPDQNVADQVASKVDIQRQNFANEIVNLFDVAVETKNLQLIQSKIDSIMRILTSTKLTPQVRANLNYQMQLIQQEAKSRNIDLNKLKPSRLQTAQKFTSQRVLPYTPVGLTVRAGEKVVGAGKSALNWLTGAR